MANISIFSRRQVKGKIGTLEIDAVLSESHEYDTTITDYPVEDGYDVTDHIQPQPEKITIEGVTTLTPFYDDNSLIEREDTSDRVQNTYNTLLEFLGFTPPKQANIEVNKRFIPQVVDVVTGLKTYTNMACRSLRVPVTNKSNNALYYTIVLQKIKKVQPELTFVPKVSSLNGKAQNINNQAPNTVSRGKTTPSDVSQSTILADWFDGFRGAESGRNLTGAVQ